MRAGPDNEILWKHESGPLKGFPVIISIREWMNYPVWYLIEREWNIFPLPKNFDLREVSWSYNNKGYWPKKQDLILILRDQLAVFLDNVIFELTFIMYVLFAWIKIIKYNVYYILVSTTTTTTTKP